MPRDSFQVREVPADAAPEIQDAIERRRQLDGGHVRRERLSVLVSAQDALAQIGGVRRSGYQSHSSSPGIALGHSPFAVATRRPA